MPVFMTEDLIALTWFVLIKFVLSKITLAVTYVFLNFWDSWLWIAVLVCCIVIICWLGIFCMLLFVTAIGIKVKLMSCTPFPHLSKAHAMFLFSSLPELSKSFPGFKTITWFCQYHSWFFLSQDSYTGISLLLLRPALYTLFFAVGFTDIWSLWKLLGRTETNQVKNTFVFFCYLLVDSKSSEAKQKLCLFLAVFAYYPSFPL